MSWRIVLAVLTGNVIFMSASYTMLIPFLPMYLVKELGVSTADVNIWSGIVFSSSFVVSTIMAPIWGRLADTRGKRLMAIRASFLLSVSYFLGGMVTTPFELTLMRLFQGFAAGLWPMSLAIMTLYAPQDKLGICLGTMQGAMTAGNIIGPLLGGVLAETFGMRMSFFVSAATLLLNCLVFVFAIKEPPASQKAMQSKPATTSRDLLRRPLLQTVLLSAALVQMVIFILQPILTTYITQLAGEVENIVLVSGVVFSLGGIAGMLASPLWGWLGQRRGFFQTLLLALTGAACGLYVQGSLTTLHAFAAFQFICGLFFCGVFPSINALLARNTEPSVKGQIFGLMFAAQQCGSIAGPIVGGVIATYVGIPPIFFLSGTMLLCIVVFLKTRGRKLFASA